MTNKQKLLGQIDYLSGTKSREKYYTESVSVGGIQKVASMEAQITQIFSEFLSRLSNLQYDLSSPMGVGYGNNYSKEDLEEIENTKKNMKEFAAKKLARANEMVDILFSQVGAAKAVVVIGKVPEEIKKVEDEIEAKKDGPVDEDVSGHYGDDKDETDGSNRDTHFYDDKENEIKYSFTQLKAFEDKSVVVVKKTGGKSYGDFCGVSDDRRAIILGGNHFISLNDIKEIKEFRKK